MTIGRPGSRIQATPNLLSWMLSHPHNVFAVRRRSWSSDIRARRMTALPFLNRTGACAGSHLFICKALGWACAEFRAPIAFTSESKRRAPNRSIPMIYGKARFASVQLT
jgi:hypothetical protein